jgi:hypothetical protein
VYRAEVKARIAKLSAVSDQRSTGPGIATIHKILNFSRFSGSVDTPRKFSEELWVKNEEFASLFTFAEEVVWPD